MAGLVIVVVAVVFLAVFLSQGMFTVKQQQVAIVERFGRFLRVARAGLHVRIPLVDRVAARLSLQVEQLELSIETKTKDNVFVTVEVAIQSKADGARAQDAYYLLDNPKAQMEAFVSDIVRSKLPGMDLDLAYADVEDMALTIERTLRERMDAYAYTIVKALVININPAREVKEAMNNINASRRNQEAAIAQGEANKTLTIKRAEAEAESKRLQGEGIAAQRQAIIDGLRQSVESFTQATGVDAEEAMQMVMLTGYTDMLRDVAASSQTNTVLLPHSPSGLGDVMAAFKGSELVGRAARKNS